MGGRAGWVGVTSTTIYSFVFGISSAGFLPAFSIARDMCKDNYVATGLSFMNMMNMIGIAIAQPLIGYFLDQLWQGQMDNGVRVYSVQAYQQSLIILPIGSTNFFASSTSTFFSDSMFIRRFIACGLTTLYGCFLRSGILV